VNKHLIGPDYNDLIHRMDFAPVAYNPMVLAVTPQTLRVDLNLFIRPFTDPSWACILATSAIILLIVIPPYIFLPVNSVNDELMSDFILQNYEYNQSHMIASTTGWLFFTVLNAYYGGALTMFFTSDPMVNK